MLTDDVNGSSGSIFGIKKLDGAAGFQVWKFHVKNYLECKNWWEAVEAEEISPALKEADRKARTTICLLLEPSCFAHVYNVKTAREAWRNLCVAYEDKGWGRRIALQRQLWSCKLENFSCMENYVSKVISIAQQLAAIDAKVSDDWIISILLAGLTSDYNPMIMAIDNSGKEISLEQIKTKLLQEANRQAEDKAGAGEQAFLSEQKKASKNNARKPVRKCFKCHKPGHKAAECKQFHAGVCLSTADTSATKRSGWYVDSGCSNHMTWNVEKLCNLEKVKSDLKIKVANGEEIPVEGRGDVKVSGSSDFTLKKVLHVPRLSMNLISVSDLVKKDFAVNFDKRGCTIKNKTDQIVATCNEVDGIFKLNEKEQYVNATLSDKPLSNLWHKRLAHLGKNYMLKLKDMVTGMDFDSKQHIEPCIPCIKGKTCKSPFRNKGTRAEQILELVHSDICGPMEEPSFAGSIYMLLFIDDYTRKTYVYFLRNKSQTFDKFREYKAEVEKETGKSIKCLRSDNGTEFCNHVFDRFFKSAGIKHQTTVPYTPEQNGVAERANRSIIEKARSLLCEANLSKKFWAEAVRTVVYLKNRSPTKAVLNKVPEELWSGKKVNLSHLKIFGCLAFALKPKQKRKKLDMKTEALIFIGYTDLTKGYRLMHPQTGKITVARDVKFLENVFPGTNVMKNAVVPLSIEEERIEPAILDAPPDVHTNVEEDFQDADTGSTESATNEEVSTETSIEPRYNLRSRKLVDYTNTCINVLAEIDGDPTTVKEALARPDRALWQKAMDDELQSLKENQTWTLVDLPRDKKPIQCKWVFKIKRDSDGKISKYKARLVAKGFTQVRGVDYNETYSPVVRSSTLRLLFSLAVEYDWDIDQWDVTTAFLYGKLKEDIYMLQPVGAITKGQETKVCKLKRSLYGLKQASNAWFNELDREMLSLGFTQSKIEPCLYQKLLGDRDRDRIVIVIYVDDIFIFCSDIHKKEKEKLKTELLKKFKVKDLGHARHVLGMRLRRDENNIYLDQEQYVINVLKDFEMTDCKPVNTPMETGIRLEKASDSDNRLPYQNLIGCLNYLAQNSRPDIAHAVSVLSQFNNCYDEIHYKCAKRVLRYLKGTSDFALTFRKSGKLELLGYVDADWGGSYDRKSFTGLMFILGENLITWESRKQRCVALSSTEAEYIGLSQASKEAIYLRSLLNSITNNTCAKPVVIYNDNQSAHHIARNKMNHNRTKHIDIRFHFIREAILNESVEVTYVSSQDMLADMLTKSLPGPKFKNALTRLPIKRAGNESVT